VGKPATAPVNRFVVRSAPAFALGTLLCVLAGCSASTMPVLDPTSRPRPVAAAAAVRATRPPDRPAHATRK